jgi:hypothetical protein
MKKKTYINILSMVRNTFCFKLLSAIAIVSFLFSASAVMSENKVTGTTHEIVLKGIVRDAHTKKPVSAKRAFHIKNLLVERCTPCFSV